MPRVIRLCLFALLVSPATRAENICADKAPVWREFMAWAQAQPAGGNPQAYRARLVANGMAEAQADDFVATIGRLYGTCPELRNEAQAASFNRLYRSEQQTRFTTDPGAFLATMTRDLKPGKALDVAMGQGRNAVYLATKGWDVTGYDIAAEGLKVAQENAAKAGVRITTVEAGWDDFDYGKERWDLIYFVYTDAPVVDPQFVAKIQAALKPGGLVLIDRPYRNLVNPEPWPETPAAKPNALLKAWSDLQIVFYEDTIGVGEWQQTAVPRLDYKLRLVHMLARKM